MLGFTSTALARGIILLALAAVFSAGQADLPSAVAAVHSALQSSAEGVHSTFQTAAGIAAEVVRRGIPGPPPDELYGRGFDRAGSLIDLEVPGLGTVRGLRGESRNGTATKFLGLPYAYPPTGNRRWMPPQALPSWSRAAYRAANISDPVKVDSLKLDCAADLGYDFESVCDFHGQGVRHSRSDAERGASTWNPSQHEDDVHHHLRHRGSGEPLDGTWYGPSCLPATTATWIKPEENVTEDCLYLNIYAPAGHIEALLDGALDADDDAAHEKSGVTGSSTKSGLLPVIVYIHGGGFIMGSSHNPSTAPEPSTFVQQGNVVFVTLNYRLGALGFTVSSALHNNGGMFGIQDQVMALKWVKEHIAAFGGDPTQVTLHGESAGAISICLHLVMPESRGLFTRAIMESGMCNFPFEDVATAYVAKERLSKAVGCWQPVESITTSAVDLHGLKPARPPPINVIMPDHVRQAEAVNEHPGAMLGADLAAGTGRSDDSRQRTSSAVASSVEGAMIAGEDAFAGWLNWHEGSAARRMLEYIPGGASVADAVALAGTYVVSTAHAMGMIARSSYAAAVDILYRHLWPAAYQAATTKPSTKRIPEDFPAEWISRDDSGPAGGTTWKHNRAFQSRPPPVWSRTQMLRDHMEMECLRSKSAAEVQHALPVRRGFFWFSGESYFPIINGIDILDHPLHLIRRGMSALDPSAVTSSSSASKRHGAVAGRTSPEDAASAVMSLHLPSAKSKRRSKGEDTTARVELLYGHNKDEASIFLLFAYPFLITHGLVRDFLNITLGEPVSSNVWRYYVEDPTTADSFDFGTLPRHLHAHGSAVGPDLVLDDDGEVQLGSASKSELQKKSKAGRKASGSAAAMSTPTLRQKTARMLNDMWKCASHSFAAALAEHGARVRVYQFNHEPSYLSALLKWLGAYHGVELDFLFAQFDGHQPTDDESLLGMNMMRLWAEFASQKRKILVRDTKADGTSAAGGWKIIDAAETGPASITATPSITPCLSESIHPCDLHIDNWPLYNNETQVCLNLRAHPFTMNGSCRPSECGMWEAAMSSSGLLQVPPQHPEPLVSTLGNVWGPHIVKTITNNLRMVVGSLVVVVLMAVFVPVAVSFQRKQKHSPVPASSIEAEPLHRRRAGIPVGGKVPAQTTGEASTDAATSANHPCSAGLVDATAGVGGAGLRQRRRGGMGRARHDDVDDALRPSGVWRRSSSILSSMLSSCKALFRWCAALLPSHLPLLAPDAAAFAQTAYSAISAASMLTPGSLGPVPVQAADLLHSPRQGGGIDTGLSTFWRSLVGFLPRPEAYAQSAYDPQPSTPVTDTLAPQPEPAQAAGEPRALRHERGSETRSPDPVSPDG